MILKKEGMSRATDYAKKNITRTPFQAIAASMVMFLTFFALQTFLLVAAGSQLTLRYFENKPQAIAFFKDGTTDQDITLIQTALDQDPRVVKTTYISKEDALKKYQSDNVSEPVLVELVTANMLPASIEISTHTPSDLTPVSEMLSKEPVIEQVYLPKDVIKNLVSFTTIVRAVGISVVAFLMIFAALVILMIIGFKIRLRRGEIEIMRLLGGSPSFIRNPFILEGMFYGAAGATSSWLIVYILLWYFTPFLKAYLGEVQLLPVSPLFMLALLGSSFVLACIIGALGSIGATRRYLKI